MENPLNDSVLLQRYAQDGSEWAFGQLVNRHLKLVYAAALRQVNDPALAQDVTQTVFLLLARKAGSLSPDVIVPGWLYRTTGHVAAKAIRTEQRRRQRETEAAHMQSAHTPSADPQWEALAPVLDDALLKLNEKDRDAIVLRYFESKSLATVGEALGVNEDTAQKRVSRALDKLRHLLGKRGVTLSAFVLGTALTTQAANATPPAMFAQTVALNCFEKAVLSPNVFELLRMSWRKFFWMDLARRAAPPVLVATGLAILGVMFWNRSAEAETLRKPGVANNSRVIIRKKATASAFISSPPRTEALSLSPTFDNGPEATALPQPQPPTQPPKPASKPATPPVTAAPSYAASSGSSRVIPLPRGTISLPASSKGINTAFGKTIAISGSGTNNVKGLRPPTYPPSLLLPTNVVTIGITNTTSPRGDARPKPKPAKPPKQITPGNGGSRNTF